MTDTPLQPLPVNPPLGLFGERLPVIRCGHEYRQRQSGAWVTCRRKARWIARDRSGVEVPYCSRHVPRG